MRIAYILTWEISTNDGVTKKIKDQVSIWKDLGHEVEIFCISRSCGESLLEVKQYQKNNVYNIFRLFIGPAGFYKDIMTFKPDFIYLRQELYKPYISRLITRIPTITETNADDVLELKMLAKKSSRVKSKFLYHLLTRGFIFRNSNGIISMTKELSERKLFTKYGKPMLICPNSIIVTPIKKRNNNKQTEIIFIGSLEQPWQGLDKVEALAEQLGDDYLFHIVGNAGSRKSHENLIYHGYLQKEEYEKIIKNCAVGIGTLALNRKGLNEACPLKVRDYIAYGLPVIIGYEDTAFLQESPEWILKISNVEDSIKNRETVAEIKKFIDEMHDYVVTKNESEQYISSAILENRKLNGIRDIL